MKILVEKCDSCGELEAENARLRSDLDIERGKIEGMKEKL